MRFSHVEQGPSSRRGPQREPPLLVAAEIVWVGLVTPVGLYAAAASAAIAAGRSRARRSELVNKSAERQAMHLIDEEYLEPLNSALSPEGMTAAHQRMLQLGGPALAEAAAPCPDPVPLLLALPEVRPGAEDPVGLSFIPQLALQAGIRVDESLSATYRQGGAGFLLLRSPQPSPQEEPRRPPAAVPTLARVLNVGTGAEKGHRYSQEPYRGDGLAEAFEALFQGLPTSAPRVRCVYAGFNGEEMPAKEWGVARLRNSERFADELRVEHPADCIGDSGAALGAIMLGLATLAIAQGHLPEPRPIWATEDPGPCLVWSTSDREPRAAALLQW